MVQTNLRNFSELLVILSCESAGSLILLAGSLRDPDQPIVTLVSELCPHALSHLLTIEP